MAVGFDASSERGNNYSNTSPQTWTHTPVGAPAGVLVFVMCDSTATDGVTAVSYGSASLTAVSGGFAQDTAGEVGFCKAYFVGSSIPTGAQTVSVSTTGSPNIACFCITVTAAADTEVYTAGIVLLQEDGTLSEQSVSDGSPGTNSMRFAGMHTGLANILSLTGANSTALQDVDDGSTGSLIVRETTAGQGSRSVGFTSASTDDRAVVHLAVREVVSASGGSGPLTGGGLILPKLIAGRLAL